MIPDLRIRAAAPWVVMSFMAVACDSTAPGETGGLAESTYVDVISALADLQRFPPPGTDSTARRISADSVRQAILDQHAVTADELLAYAERVGKLPGRMETISERIVEQSDSLARERAVGRGFDGPSGGVGDTLDVDPETPATPAEAPAAAADSGYMGPPRPRPDG